MPFQSHVESTAGLGDAYRRGLQALEQADRERLEVASPRDLCGSVAVDTALRTIYPMQSRWDYIVCQRKQSAEKLHFIEVHPATTKEHIREVTAKAGWLLTWLSTTPLANTERKLHWIATGTVAFNQRNPALKALAQAGVVLRGSKLSL